MKRIAFIKSASITAVGMSTIGTIIRAIDGTYHGDCETTNDILGPFYRPDAPLRSDLTYTGLEGTVIQIDGCVYGADCVTPLSNALVEIWHCNKDGVYDNESSAFNQRAQIKTDDQGSYSFKTIFPGKYMNGQLYRPAHIHFRVRAENSKELVSQIYFDGDRDIAKDPWASKEKAAKRILEVKGSESDQQLAVTFDIYLDHK